MLRGSKKCFFEHAHVAHLIEGDDERNRIQVKCPPKAQTGDLEVMLKGQISLNFNYNVNFKDFFIPNSVCVLTNKSYNKYLTEFSFWCLVLASGIGLGGAGGGSIT